ncbi:MAG: hypothetical protein IPG91_05530 [Ideonella sp.]|nr:hypothetical protein [Ideonella sp.]
MAALAAGGKLAASDICEQTGMHPMNASRSVAHLARLGRVRRGVDPATGVATCCASRRPAGRSSTRSRPARSSARDRARHPGSRRGRRAARAARQADRWRGCRRHVCPATRHCARRGDAKGAEPVAWALNFAPDFTARAQRAPGAGRRPSGPDDRCHNEEGRALGNSATVVDLNREPRGGRGAIHIAYLDPPYSRYFQGLSQRLARRTGGEVLALLSSPAYAMYTGGDRHLVWPPGRWPTRRPCLPMRRTRCGRSRPVTRTFAPSSGMRWRGCARTFARTASACAWCSRMPGRSRSRRRSRRATGVRCLYVERGALRAHAHREPERAGG